MSTYSAFVRSLRFVYLLPRREERHHAAPAVLGFVKRKRLYPFLQENRPDRWFTQSIWLSYGLLIYLKISHAQHHKKYQNRIREKIAQIVSKEKRATASIITGFAATFCFHKCQTRDYRWYPPALSITICIFHIMLDNKHNIDLSSSSKSSSFYA